MPVDDFAKVCVRLLLICKLAVARHGHDFFFVDVLFDDMIVHRRQELTAQAVVLVLMTGGERFARFFHVLQEAAVSVVDKGDACFKIFQEAVHKAHSIFA